MLSVASIFVATGIVIAGNSWRFPWERFTPYVFYMQKEMVCAFLGAVLLITAATGNFWKGIVFSTLPYIFFLVLFNPYPTARQAATFKSTFSDVFVRIRIVALVGIGFRTFVKKERLEPPLLLIFGGYFLILMAAYLSWFPTGAFDFLRGQAFFPVKLTVYGIWLWTLWKYLAREHDAVQTSV